MTELDKLRSSDETKGEQLSSNSSIAVEIYHSFEALADKQQEWDHFMESSGSEIFLTYDWCRTWWKYYGHKRDLAIFIFRDSSEICGLLPLFSEKIWLGLLSTTVVKMVSSDFMPVTVNVPIKHEYIDQVVDRLIPEVNAQWRWHLLYLGAICGRYDSQDALTNAFKNRLGHKYHIELKESDVQTYFTVEPDWETQVGTLVNTQRRKAKKTFRETSSKGIDISSHLATKETLTQMFDNFVLMHQKHWTMIGMAGHFAAWPFAKEFHCAIAEIQLKHNRLRFIETKFNNMPVGYEYAYKLHDTYYWFLNARSDFDERINYKWISFRSTLECAWSDNVKTIDAMRGMYDYKILMGGKVVPIKHLFIYSSQFPIKQRVLVFQQLAKVINILYYRIWRTRLAPKLGYKLTTFWKKWVRLYHFSS